MTVDETKTTLTQAVVSLYGVLEELEAAGQRLLDAAALETAQLDELVCALDIGVRRPAGAVYDSLAPLRGADGGALKALAANG